MDIKHIDSSAPLYLLKSPQAKTAPQADPQQTAGDVVNLSSRGSSPAVAFDSENDTQAYQGVLNAAQVNPDQLVQAHSGLDQERVYRLLGLIE